MEHYGHGEVMVMDELGLNEQGTVATTSRSSPTQVPGTTWNAKDLLY